MISHTPSEANDLHASAMLLVERLRVDEQRCTPNKKSRCVRSVRSWLRSIDGGDGRLSKAEIGLSH